MNILIVINSVLPAMKYGGTERVMWYLGKELARMGNKVHFLAAKGSVCDFARMHIFRPGVAMEKQIPMDVDVVHFNNYVPCGFSAKPYIVTFHGNNIHGDTDRNAVFVSRNHAHRFASDQFVYNGLDWNDYGELYEGVRSYFHFLGNAAWRVKNVRGCIRMIKKMHGQRLYVLGGYRFNFKMGLRLTLTPKVSFKGMVGGEEKTRYLQHSKGLAFPILWDEPFGLAVTESLYCGAPVFATPFGSLPELVTNEVGALSRSESELISQMLHAESYSAAVCHEYAGDLFNSRRMAEAYIGKYEKVISGEHLNANHPHPVQPFNKYEMIP